MSWEILAMRGEKNGCGCAYSRGIFVEEHGESGTAVLGAEC